MSDSITSLVDAVSKFVKLLTDMKKRDMLVIGFIFMFVALIGVLIGVIPSPVLTVEAQQQQILRNQETAEKIQLDIVELLKKQVSLQRLQLYIDKESCLHSAKTTTDLTRCNRSNIDDAIKGDELADPETSLLTPTL